MPDLMVASTTDTQEQVNQAAGAKQEEAPEEKAAPTGDQQVDSEAVQKTEQPEKATPDPLKKMEKRIDKLTAQAREAERKAAELEVKLREKETQPIKTEPAKPAEAKSELRPRPKLGETIDPKTGKPHETQEQYEDDLLAWYDEGKELRAAKQEADAQAKEVLDTYNESVKTFSEEHDDWPEVVGNTTVTIPQGVQIALMEMARPDVVYHLAKNPKIASELMEMTPARAVAEVGRIAAQLEAGAPSPAEGAGINAAGSRTGPDRSPVVSNAPAPIKPLKGHSTVSQVPIDELPYNEFRKVRDKQEKERFRR